MQERSQRLDDGGTTTGVLPSLDEAWATHVAGDMFYNPLKFLNRVRAEQPVYRTPAGFWLVTRYADALKVFRSDSGAPISKSYLNSTHPPARLSGDGHLAKHFRNNVQSRDAPDHTRLRRLLHRSFTPHAVEQMRLQTRTIIERQLDEVEQRTHHEMDLMSEFAVSIPAAVILKMLGIPDDETAGMTEMLECVRQSSQNAEDPEWRSRADAVLEERHEYLLGLVAERRRRPGDDLISRLAVAQAEDPTCLTDLEITANVSIVILGGFENTVNTIGSGVILLLAHPEQLDMLKNDPRLFPRAVEEILRYAPAFHMGAPRWASEDTVIGEQQIRKGDELFVSIMAANHDPAEFPDPDRFDVTATRAHSGISPLLH